MAWWRGQDSNLRSPSGRQIYSLVALTTHPPLHADGTNPVPDPCVAEPQRGLEPLTCRLQVDCANRLRHWGASSRQRLPRQHNTASPVAPATKQPGFTRRHPCDSASTASCHTGYAGNRQLSTRFYHRFYKNSPIPAPRPPPARKRRPPSLSIATTPAASAAQPVHRPNTGRLRRPAMPATMPPHTPIIRQCPGSAAITPPPLTTPPSTVIPAQAGIHPPPTASARTTTTLT